MAAASYDRARVVGAAEADAQRTAVTLREHALKVIATHEILIRQLDRRVQGMSWDRIRANGAALAEEMRAMQGNLPDVASLSLTDPQGRIVVSTLPIGAEGYPSVAHRDYWLAQRDADQGTFVSRPYLGIVNHRLNFALSRRRTTPDGGFDGTVHITIAASYFTRLWSEAVLGKAGVAVDLLRSDGEILARFPEVPGPLPRLTPLIEHLQRQTGADRQKGVFALISPIDGIKRIYAYEKLEDYPLIAGYGVSMTSVLATWWRHVLVLGTICMLAAAALALAMLTAMRQARLLADEQARRATIEITALDGQRFELLGQMAAGVAHDFRNIIHAVGVGAQLMERGAADPERVRALSRIISGAAERGESLAQRILDVARRHADKGDRAQDGAGAETDPAKAVTDVCQLLSRTLGAGIRVRCEVEAADLPERVRGEPGGLEAAVMNLAVNARDAMPDGGDLMIRAAGDRVGQHADEVGPPRPAGLAPGSYVRVSVADTGAGMSAEVLALAGQPFFTTKPRGQGTGLGLAGARGFAERWGGALQIASAPGEGTTVTFWLPAAPAGAAKLDHPKAA